jgi:hypothetical protein
MPGLLCDFCSSPSPTQQYPCQNFRLAGQIRESSPPQLQWSPATPDQTPPPVTFESVSSWAACDDCHLLITGEHRNALVERATRRFLGEDPSLIGIQEDLRLLFDSFFESRSGSAIPIPNPDTPTADSHMSHS